METRYILSISVEDAKELALLLDTLASFEQFNLEPLNEEEVSDR